MPASWKRYRGGALRRWYREPPKPSAEEQLAALATVAGVLEAAGADWWLTYGALLGWIREGRFLPHDTDIDLAILPGADPAAIAAALIGAGLVLYEEWADAAGTRMQKFRCGACKFDLYYVVTEGGFRFDQYPISGRRGGRAFARGSHPVMPTVAMNLDGVTVRVPSEPERYLLHLYGPGWRVPAIVWDWRFSAPNAQLFVPLPELPGMWLRRLKWRKAARREVQAGS